MSTYSMRRRSDGKAIEVEQPKGKGKGKAKKAKPVEVEQPKPDEIEPIITEDE